MSTTVWRWLLAPRTSWHAWRLVRTNENGMSFDTAWRHTRLRLHPDELAYRQYGHFPDGVPGKPRKHKDGESGRRRG